VESDTYLVYVIDCADTSIIRTPSRQELLYTRSQIVVAAKTFGLDAIDMVSDDWTPRSCGHWLHAAGLYQLQRSRLLERWVWRWSTVRFQREGIDNLRTTIFEFRWNILSTLSKPSTQLRSTWSSPRLCLRRKVNLYSSSTTLLLIKIPHVHADILRAAKILYQMEVAHASHIGAFGLELEDGGKEMIDAPMLKQVSSFGTATPFVPSDYDHHTAGRENHSNCESGWDRDTKWCLM